MAVTTSFERRVQRMRERYFAKLKSQEQEAGMRGREAVEGNTKGPAPQAQPARAEEKSFAELRAEAKAAGVKGYGRMSREQLIGALLAPEAGD